MCSIPIAQSLSSTPAGLGPLASVPVVKQNLREATEAFQRETIRQALAQNHHNWAACARMLETDVANLHRLAKRLGLKD
ncbi:hypothetical protein K1D89_22680 [Escherichia coli]|nr:hypothetical protein [Escherichia coli]